MRFRAMAILFKISPLFGVAKAEQKIALFCVQAKIFLLNRRNNTKNSTNEEYVHIQSNCKANCKTTDGQKPRKGNFPCATLATVTGAICLSFCCIERQQQQRQGQQYQSVCNV